MKNQYLIGLGITTYLFGFLIIVHWACICPFDEFLNLYDKGFSQKTIAALPDFLKPLYKGVPNLITLISYMLFTFSAFLLISQKRKRYFYMSMSAFVLIIYLFLFLVNA